VAGGEVREHRVDGLLRVLLVGPDHARGAALDPADHVLPGHRLARLQVEDAPARVGDHAAALVEWDPGERDAAVADRAEGGPGRDRLVLVAWLRTERSCVGGEQLVADEL